MFSTNAVGECFANVFTKGKRSLERGRKREDENIIPLNQTNTILNFTFSVESEFDLPDHPF
jgi:hypothetical protein